MMTSSVPIIHRPAHEVYLTPRWVVAALTLGWRQYQIAPILDPAAGGDGGWTIGGMLYQDANQHALRDPHSVQLFDIRPSTEVTRALGVKGGIDFEQLTGTAPGWVIATNPPYSRLDQWIDRGRDIVGPSGYVCLLVARLSLTAAGELPSGCPRREGLDTLVQLTSDNHRVSSRVRFELTRQTAVERCAVNLHWHPKWKAPQELRAEAAALLDGPRGKWVRELSPAPSKPLPVVKDAHAETGWVIGSPATDHAWAVWRGRGASEPEFVRTVFVDVTRAREHLERNF